MNKRTYKYRRLSRGMNHSFLSTLKHLKIMKNVSSWFFFFRISITCLKIKFILFSPNTQSIFIASLSLFLETNISNSGTSSRSDLLS